MKKRTIFYEDIEYLELVDVESEVNAIEHWRKQLAGKEFNYYYDHRKDFDKSEEQQGLFSVMALPALNLGSSENFDRLIHNLSYLGFELSHKKPGDRTEEPYFRLIRATRKGFSKDVYIGFYIRYTEWVICEAADGLRQKQSNIPAKKTLFYEDIEEVSIVETEERVLWYEGIAEKRTRYEYESSLKEKSLSDIILKYEAWQVDGDTLPFLEEKLLRRGYEFRHKTKDDQTEQLESSLLKIVEEGNVLGYLYAYLTPLIYDREVNRMFPKNNTQE